MQLFYFVLLLLAGVFFGLSAARRADHRADFLSLGLLCWVLVPMIQQANHL